MFLLTCANAFWGKMSSMQSKATRRGRARFRRVVPYSPILDGNTKYGKTEWPWAQQSEEKVDKGKNGPTPQENSNLHDTALRDPNGQQRPWYSKSLHVLSPIRQHDRREISTSPVKVRGTINSSGSCLVGVHACIVVPVAERM